MQFGILIRGIWRSVRVATGIVIVAGALSVAYRCWLVPKGVEPYSLSHDVRSGTACLVAIESVEQRWWSTHNRYVTSEEFSSKRDVALNNDSHLQSCEGFSFNITANNLSYSIQLVPMSSNKLLSFFIQKDGPIRIGTREHPATANSGLLRP